MKKVVAIKVTGGNPANLFIFSLIAFEPPCTTTKTEADDFDVYGLF